MEITLTPDQEAFIRRAISSGRFDRAEDAVTEALVLWEEREMARANSLTSLDEAEAAMDQGAGTFISEETMRSLAEDVKRRGRERLSAKRSMTG